MNQNPPHLNPRPRPYPFITRIVNGLQIEIGQHRSGSAGAYSNGGYVEWASGGEECRLGVDDGVWAWGGGGGEGGGGVMVEGQCYSCDGESHFLFDS